MRLLFCCTLALCLLTPAARADFIITGGNATVAAGGTATVDFTITSTNPAVDNLAAFNLELLISTASGSSFLQFTATQPDFSGDPAYVFSGNSGVGAAFWGAPFSTVTANDTIAGGDFTADFSGATIASSDLLARVQFQADPHASAGDTYTVALVPDATQTYFNDFQGDTIAYTSTGATVSVLTQSTPAPPSLLLLGIAGVAGLVYARRAPTRQ